jgi:hypothetical protein
MQRVARHGNDGLLAGATFGCASESLQINLVSAVCLSDTHHSNFDHELESDDNDTASGECQEQFVMRPSEYSNRTDPEAIEEIRVLQDVPKDAS